ncbi:MAG: thiaminase II [Rhizobiaceae bacterium]
MSYGKIFDLWREASGENWHSYTRHSFVLGLGDGSLPREAFLHYLIQDYSFLIHFSRAWALAIAKAESVEEMRLCAATVNGLINEEITLHIKICAEEGISESELFAAQERPENLAYTRYVLDAGYSGDFLDLLAALTPCVMGYCEIGTALAASSGETPYQEWIDAYSSEDYQAYCIQAGALIDGAVASRLGNDPTKSPRWAKLCDRFDTATRLEVGFWDMGLNP